MINYGTNEVNVPETGAFDVYDVRDGGVVSTAR